MALHFLTNPAGADDKKGELWMRRIILAFSAAAILLGAAQAWISRYAMNPDGVQYLDNADAWWSGDFQHALSSIWSPLYPWLIGAFFRIVHPNPFQEFPLVHLLNFFIYLLSLAAFLFFLRSLNAICELAPAIRASLVLLACSSFLYCSLDFATLAYVTPDLLVNLFAFLAAGLLLRTAAGAASGAQFAALGLVLGLGYLAKSPFLLFGLFALGIAAVLARKRPAAMPRILLAAAVFVAVAAPYIWALSSAKGRLTFGDSGKANIVWHVNGVSPYNWQGRGSDNGKPIHSTRQLSSDPAIFEFATPVAGTYPPWYDPIYWSEGARIAYRPADFARAFVEQIKLYGYLLHHRQLPLVFALVLLFLLASNKRDAWRFWPLLCFGALPFFMYAFVHAEGRYLAPFFVILWTALFAGLLSGLPETLDRRFLLTVASVTAALMLVETITVVRPDKPIGSHYAVARSLRQLGLKPGDPVAIVSGDFDYYWARLARARITMQVDFTDSACPNCRHQAEWEKAKQILSANGATFVVSGCVPEVVDQPGWQQLGSTGAYAYRLR